MANNTLTNALRGKGGAPQRIQDQNAVLIAQNERIIALLESLAGQEARKPNA